MTNSNVWLTNVSAVLTNGAVSLSFGIAGGSNGVAYDVFATTALIGSYPSNSFWAWMGQGFQCNNYSINGLPTNSPCFLILGTPQDSDSDGLTDAFELLVSKTNPYQADTDGDGIPDGWQWAYFGSLQPADGDYDGDGVSNLDEYLNGTDPNKIQFSLEVTNQYMSTNLLPMQIAVLSGVPSSMAVLVDNVNFTNATWTAYNSNLLVSLGTNEGWHDVWVGCRGLPQNAQQTWSWVRFKLDFTPPHLVITSPASASGSWPMVQVQGYSLEPLSSLSYDITNANGLLTNQFAGVSEQFYDTNTCEFTTNYFQAYDIRLAPGTNVMTFYATDLAGNATATNYTLVLASNNIAPVITLNSPQNSAVVCGSAFTVDGWIDNPSAGMVASFVDTNGVTNSIVATVERNGRFWAENLPLVPGTNLVTLTASDFWGNITETNLMVVGTNFTLTIDPLDPNALNTDVITVTGTVGDPSYSVLVNGIQATVDSGGNWQADNVPVNSGGTASFEAQAYPPGQSPPGNSPSVPQSKSNTDKAPYVYVLSDTQKYTVTSNSVWMEGGAVVDYANETTTFSQNWTAGGGGGSAYSDQGITWGDGVTNSYYGGITVTWPATLWPNIGGLQIGTGYCTNVSTNGPTPNIGQEHCDISRPRTWTIIADGPGPWNQTVVTYKRTAQTKMTLFTGGKAAARKSFFVLYGNAAEIVDSQRLPPYGYSSSDPGMRNIPYNQIVLGELGNLLPNGTLYKALPDGISKDVTPTVAGKPIYLISTGLVGKYVPTSTCHASTPTDKTRTTIGVGEEVDLGFSPSMASLPYNPSWTISAGSLSGLVAYPNSAAGTTMTAPSNAANSTVTASIGKESVTFNFTVLEPTGIDHTDFIEYYAYSSTTLAGAGVHLRPYVAPLNVSFYRVQVIEVGEDASSVNGYFTVHTPPSHIGNGADTPIQLNEDNSWDPNYDWAKSSGWPSPWASSGPPPYSGGSYTWDIPARWQVGAAGQTNTMTGWNQVHSLDASGTMTINKFGHTVSRTIQNVYSGQ